jgi:hypothetical protein
MEALIERARTRRHDIERAVYACGWCKGFVHEERVSDMARYVHDEKPLTPHEVLPYRVR